MESRSSEINDIGAIVFATQGAKSLSDSFPECGIGVDSDEHILGARLTSLPLKVRSRLVGSSKILRVVDCEASGPLVGYSAPS